MRDQVQCRGCQSPVTRTTLILGGRRQCGHRAGAGPGRASPSCPDLCSLTCLTAHSWHLRDTRREMGTRLSTKIPEACHIRMGAVSRLCENARPKAEVKEKLRLLSTWRGCGNGHSAGVGGCAGGGSEGSKWAVSQTSVSHSHMAQTCISAPSLDGRV